MFLHFFNMLDHTLKCTQIDDCDSFITGLPKVRLSLLQSVLYVAARLKAPYNATLIFLPSCLNNCTDFLSLRIKLQNRHSGLHRTTRFCLEMKYAADVILWPVAASHQGVPGKMPWQ